MLAAIALLLCGYIFYGGHLCRKWGIDSHRKTPAYEKEDGVDYVPSKPIVLMGHHFSSIAGSGPINGTIQAAIFGWVPVFLWCVIGAIVFGGKLDSGSMFASVRNDGKSIGEIIRNTMGRRAQKLFTMFCLIVVLLVIASFTNVVCGTFCSTDGSFGFVTSPTGNQTTALISVLYIGLAIAYGFLTTKLGVKTGPATILGIVGIVLMILLGLKVGFAMDRTGWIIFIAIYLVIASLLPVWTLLQPRDYLSSYLLYSMISLAVVGVVVSAFTGNASFSIPAFTGFKSVNGTYLFPTLFITVAGGACSGFHSLVSSGTSSKQLNNEKYIKPIGYGSMMIEAALGIVALIAVGMVYDRYMSGEFSAPPVAFAQGVAIMFAKEGTVANNTISALITLSVSVFALTSLDTAARLSRFMFSELLLKEGEQSYKDATGIRRFLAHPLFATCFMVALGATLGFLQLSQIWGLFGAANQQLAGIAFLALAVWMGNMGKDNKMFYIPMVFMFAVSLTAFTITCRSKLLLITSAEAAWGDWFQLIIAAAMGILAIFLIIEGITTFRNKKKTA